MWPSVIGEMLVCHHDTRNRYDPFAVATCKGATVASKARSYLDGPDTCDLLFLGKPGASITCSVGGSRGCRNVLVVESSYRIKICELVSTSQISQKLGPHR